MKNKEILILKCLVLAIIAGWMIPGIAFSGLQVQTKEAVKTLPPLKNLVEAVKSNLTHSSNSEIEPKLQEIDIIFEVKKNYFLIQAKNAQLVMSREVKGHFEKAVNGAQEKFDEGEEDISQAAITKLKLGLSGTLNDILEFESEKDLARLELQKLLGWSIASDFNMEESEFLPPEFPHSTVQGFLQYKKADGKSLSEEQRFLLEKEMIRIKRSRGAYELANKNRKMTRALLVTEVANYDFGIGNEGDLFEALIIYTRLLVGYNEALYDYKLAVLELERTWAQLKRQPPHATR